MVNEQAYLIGIKGVAMTAMAVYLKQKGFKVTGSDVADAFATDKILKQNKIQVKKGFFKKNISRKYDLVIATGAHGGMTNIEVITASKLGCQVWMHGKYLGNEMSEKKGIAIAGCHGKTTTSAMIASIMMHAGYDPSYAVGTAYINDLGPAGHWGRGEFFIAEADEYMTCPQTDKTPRFLWMKPHIAVFTNIEFDHPDSFTDLNEVKEAFVKFADRLSHDGVLIACVDDSNVANILAQINRPIITYGFSPRAHYRIDKYYFGNEVSFMRVVNNNVEVGEFMLKLSGKHNLLNALAASIAANLAGVPWRNIKDFIKLYSGSNRRFELIDERNGMKLFDDYAHHPSEIISTLRAFRTWYPDKKLLVLFQPHTFTRTKFLFRDFAKSFVDADRVILVDIFPSAREQHDSSISSEMLAVEANKYRRNVLYINKKSDILAFIAANKNKYDLLITMGAGDLNKWHDDIIKQL